MLVRKLLQVTFFSDFFSPLTKSNTTRCPGSLVHYWTR